MDIIQTSKFLMTPTNLLRMKNEDARNLINKIANEYGMAFVAATWMEKLFFRTR